MDYGLRMMMGGGFYFWLVPLVIFLFVVYSGYKAFGPRKKSVNSNSDSKTPLEIAKSSLANGEISEEEYEKIKRKLVKD
ncbi:hypothetical protein GCM10011351_29170 [Paraliobacillus quinghaiensis]|uniref:SHOCT domain-containing protein n=1 Tax=Paraliobacillus quinghaiensis TaxID=470815 RepID=A0A917WYG4_9BACI|nr:SHOCT domain-containing protein [Paraliobacillus quinghaiensis]GGM41121.1 hypothetical protein GCM10011351_29170 [Paraliobacillus quinghaiensis]